MSTITTHILDTVLGKPASGVAIRLDELAGDSWLPVADSATDKDGRCSDLCPDGSPGTYRILFFTLPYFERQGRYSIYPEIAITFQLAGDPHYHLPLLLSENSYTTYRGS
jgi:5-hydroxyisourate hydrolase